MIPSPLIYLRSKYQETVKCCEISTEISTYYDISTQSNCYSLFDLIRRIVSLSARFILTFHNGTALVMIPIGAYSFTEYSVLKRREMYEITINVCIYKPTS